MTASRPTTRTLWLLSGAGSLALAAASVALTLWLELQPCHLCIFQRLLFMVIGVIALGAALSAGWVRRGLGVLVALSAVAGGVTASYQTWLQGQPPGSVSCTGGDMGPIEVVVEWLGQQVPSLFLATGFCEDEGLRVLGLSLAQWSLLCFSGLLAMTLWLIQRERRHPDAMPTR
ncbi:MAG: disulfide bond formation protein B [Bdellovibrio bacteriovorus]